MRTILLGLVALVSLVGAAQAASTKVYRWVDEEGVVHYADQPRSSEAESVTIRDSRPAPPSASSAPAATGEEERASGQQRLSDERCAAARKRLDTYQRAPFLFETDAQGKRRILGEQEREEVMEAARQEVEQACQGVAPAQ
jgi:hypothetical protein